MGTNGNNFPKTLHSHLRNVLKSQTPAPIHLLSSLFHFRGCEIFPKAFRSQSQIQPRPSHSQESSAAQASWEVAPGSRGSLKKAHLTPHHLCSVHSVCKKDDPFQDITLPTEVWVLHLALGRLSLSPGSYLFNDSVLVYLSVLSGPIGLQSQAEPTWGRKARFRTPSSSSLWAPARQKGGAASEALLLLPPTRSTCHHVEQTWLQGCRPSPAFAQSPNFQLCQAWFLGESEPE